MRPKKTFVLLLAGELLIDEVSYTTICVRYNLCTVQFVYSTPGTKQISQMEHLQFHKISNKWQKTNNKFKS